MREQHAPDGGSDGAAERDVRAALERVTDRGAARPAVTISVVAAPSRAPASSDSAGRTSSATNTVAPDTSVPLTGSANAAIPISSPTTVAVIREIAAPRLAPTVPAVATTAEIAAQ